MPAVIKSIKIGAFIACANFIIQGISFLVQNFIARNLGTSTYGFFGVLQTDFAIFSAIADFGMATLILAYFGKRATSRRLFKNVLQLRLLTTVTAAIAMVAFALFVRHDHPAFWGEIILAFGLLFQHAFFDWYFICGNFWKKLLISKILHTISYTSIMGIALCILRFDSIAPIAFAMVVAALPAFGFGVRQAFSPAVLKIGNHARRFFLLMFKSAVPYAVAGIASFAYLPVGLYTASHAAGPEFLGSYNFAHKLVTLASGLMVYFISSSLISLHQTDSRTIHLRDIGIFMLFIATVSTPFTLFPEWSLQIIFFAAPWTDQVLDTSSTCLRILSISLILQALRMSMISTLLKERRMQLYCTLIVLGGILNIIVCYYGSGLFKQECIPALALSGDVFLTIAVTLYFTAKRRIHW